MKILKTRCVLFRHYNSNVNFYYVGKYIKLSPTKLLLIKGFKMQNPGDSFEIITMKLEKNLFIIDTEMIETQFRIHLIKLIERNEHRLKDHELELYYKLFWKDYIDKTNHNIYLGIFKDNPSFHLYIFGYKQSNGIIGIDLKDPLLHSRSIYMSIAKFDLLEPVIFLDNYMEADELISRYSWKITIPHIVTETIEGILDKNIEEA